VIGAGEVGMGNTTSSAACLAAALGIGAVKAAGRGAGLTDEAFRHKVDIIDKSIALHKPDANDPIDILSKVGGLDIAGLAGLFIGAAHFRIPIIIDGFISAVAALLAYKMNPLAKEYMIPSHISEEPGYAIIMKEMSLNPMLDLSMRLGEGTGCPLAMQLIDASLAIISEMLSFDASILDEETYKSNLTGGEN
jgi:nicotinate-nucleotide--dimethylbenzimidazole phosphoribosyltransferase